MKLVFFALATMISLSAKADIPAPRINIQTYQATQSQIDPAHAQRPGAVSLQINYAQKTVKLMIVRQFYCPPGAACAMVMPAPLIVELPIVSVKSKECGIKEVVAKIDKRPVDGALAQIKVEDTSHLTCQFFVERLSKATYLTASHTRGSEATSAKSTMLLRLSHDQEGNQDDNQDVTVRQFKLSTDRYAGHLENYGTYEVPAAGTVKISATTVELNVSVKLDCPTDFLCPVYLPAPIQAKLPIVKIVKSFCGDKITALMDRRAIDGNLQKIEIVDNSNALCEKVISSLIELEYTISAPSFRNEKASKAVLLFN